jgi:hypothetical protein
MKVKNQFLFLSSMVLLAVFCYLAIGRLRFLARAKHDIGVVRGLWAENDTCRRGKMSYQCTKFYVNVDLQSDRSGQLSRLDAGYAMEHDQHVSKALYQPGDRVRVVFNPNRPEEILRDKLEDLWGPSFYILIMLIVTLTISFRDPELREPVSLKLNGWEG